MNVEPITSEEDQYKARVRIELQELVVKCEKLEDFLDTKKFADLEIGMQKILIGQLIAMNNYRAFLELRVELFDELLAAQVQEDTDSAV